MTHLIVMSMPRGPRETFVIVFRGTLEECKKNLLDYDPDAGCRIIPADSPLGEELTKRNTYQQGLKIRQAATKVAEAAVELHQAAMGGNTPDKATAQWANKVIDEAVAIASASYLRNL